MNHRQVFQEALANSENTAIELPPADVNKIIKEHYTVDKPFTYTRTMLWDMETQKAHDPTKFLGGVVLPGSAKVFNVERNGDIETFVRVSDQRRWLNRDEYSTVIELVRLDHAAHSALFIGIDEVDGPEGHKIVRGKEMAKFHVEHSTTGPEDAPLNLWHIVHLDQDESGGIKKAFDGFAKIPYLRPFNEIYIRDVLGRYLVRK
ncbi:hypothetical protein NQ176_g775 [Zarea fungicola]|uniref:Uncharacterized protein n=1 Tax=Zarea fungicola TaxID=93591 RepID=A0ACC1NVG0_9HYPO|nr:hypothetical protein NQ176_g775 [Lecanicillium fungicola]